MSSRAESESLTDRLTVLESDLAQTYANADAQLNWHKTELARQEAAWRESLQSQERLHIIMHSLTAGLIIANREGRIVEANVASEILLDRDTEELKGTDLQAICDDPDWKQAVLTASGGDAPAVRLTISVGTNTLLCDIGPIAGTEADQDLAEGIVVVMQDISSEMDEYQGRGSVFAQIASIAQELQSSSATAANYANLVLSDTAVLADPLLLREGTEASVAEGQYSTSTGSRRQRSTTTEGGPEGSESRSAGGVGGALAERATDATGQKFLLRLRTSVERTAQIADELVHLVTSPFGQGHHRPFGVGPSGNSGEPLPAVDVNQLIETAVADSQSQLKDKALVLDLELPDRLPAVEVNLDDLRRVMANLLLNACLASPTGGRIKVQASHSDGPLSGLGRSDSNGDSFVLISVRDWAGGLPHEALGQVFDRARPGRTPQGLGASGADLALVKTLVESQRGHVWVETEKGVGTTFTLALPIEERG